MASVFDEEMEGIWYQINARRNDMRKQNDHERHSLVVFKKWVGTGTGTPTSDRWPMPREIYMSSTRWVVCLVNQQWESHGRAKWSRVLCKKCDFWWSEWLIIVVAGRELRQRRRRNGMEEDGWNLIREEWMKCENDQRSRLVSLALTSLWQGRKQRAGPQHHNQCQRHWMN